MLQENDDLLNPRPSKEFVAAIAAVVFCFAFGGYALHEHYVTKSLAAENGQLVAALNTTHNQLDQLTATVNSMAARGAQPALQPAPPVAPAAGTKKPSAIHLATAMRHHAEDPRYKKLQAQLDSQGKAIEDTRNDLASTRTELTGSIAKTHNELVLLERKGERNYYEFDINKSKQFSRHGDMGIRLKKANDKHQYADLELLVDDRNLSQKHVNLYQPIMFYTPDSPQPVELVVNKISKNHIHGYVSVSKYRQSELESMASTQNQSAPPDAENTDTQSQRQKLTVSHQ